MSFDEQSLKKLYARNILRDVFHTMLRENPNQNPDQNPERVKELIETYQQKLGQIEEEDKSIHELIGNVTKDEKTRLPFGPTIFRTKTSDLLESHESAFNTNLESDKERYCASRSGNDQRALNECYSFCNKATEFGLKFFNDAFKYQYTAAYEADDE